MWGGCFGGRSGKKGRGGVLRKRDGVVFNGFKHECRRVRRLLRKHVVHKSVEVLRDVLGGEVVPRERGADARRHAHRLRVIRVLLHRALQGCTSLLEAARVCEDGGLGLVEDGAGGRRARERLRLLVGRVGDAVVAHLQPLFVAAHLAEEEGLDTQEVGLGVQGERLVDVLEGAFVVVLGLLQRHKLLGAGEVDVPQRQRSLEGVLRRRSVVEHQQQLPLLVLRDVADVVRHQAAGAQLQRPVAVLHALGKVVGFPVKVGTVRVQTPQLHLLLCASLLVAGRDRFVDKLHRLVETLLQLRGLGLHEGRHVLLLNQVVLVGGQHKVLDRILALIERGQQRRDRLKDGCDLEGRRRLQLALEEPESTEEVVLVPQLETFAQRLLCEPLDHRLGANAAHCVSRERERGGWMGGWGWGVLYLKCMTLQ
eukprot:Rhum_TRINITY_DN4499_c0_g1::Rhum_TRINITY_DN4499_c0_g1_i1::g.14564::m.14564